MAADDLTVDFTASAEAEEHQHAPIAFPEPEEEEHEPSRLDVEREKHKARAAKFQVDYVEPEKRPDLRLDARKERFNRPGFATGVDIFTAEEQAKLAQRAARFGLPEDSGLAWKPPQADPDAEKKRQRAARFGVEYVPKDETGLMDVDLFEARRDPSAAVPRRPEAVHMYGVDLMSTNDCLKYFADYGPKFVEWINDSSANVLFADALTAKRAVAGLGKPLPPEEAPEQMGIDPSDPASIQFLWHKGEDFMKAGTPIPLIFRIATVDDAKASDRVPSRRLWVSASGGARGGGQQRPRGGQQQQQQQQQGYEEEDGEGGRQQRGRGNRRYKQRRGGRPAGWQHDDRGAEEGGEGGEGGAEGDAEMTEQQRRRQRRPRTKRRRGGDVDMADAEGAGYGGEEMGSASQRFRRGSDDERLAGGFAAAAPVAATLAGPPREQVSYGDL